MHTKQPTGRDIALIAMTGGQSVAITDQFERFGFNVPELSQQSYDRLAEFFMTVGGSYRNPFDAASTIRSEAENLQKILEIIADEPIINGGVALEFRSRGYEKEEDLDEIIDLLDDHRNKTNQPLILMMPTYGVMTGDLEEAAKVPEPPRRTWVRGPPFVRERRASAWPRGGLPHGLTSGSRLVARLPARRVHFHRLVPTGSLASSSR